MNKGFKILLGIVFFAVLLAVNFTNLPLRLDMRTAYYGVPVLSYISALGGTIVCFQFAQKIPDHSIVSKILLAIGGASMTIMYCHVFFMNICSYLHLSNLLFAPVIIMICYLIHRALACNQFIFTLFVGASAPTIRR